MKICLDPGHGGIDPGAVGRTLKLKEKDVNLRLAVKVENILRNKSIETVMTRRDDSYVSLHRRCQIANAERANFFVSIHVNSVVNRTANGIETYCLYRGYSAERLSKYIQNRITKSTGLRSRGVKVANFYVLRVTYMAAALVEVGFISNANEEELLTNDLFLNMAAEGIADGIMDMINE